MDTFRGLGGGGRRMLGIRGACSAGIAGVKFGFELHALILSDPCQSFV